MKDTKQVPLRNACISNKFHLYQSHLNLCKQLRQKCQDLSIEYIIHIGDIIEEMTKNKSKKNYDYENFEQFLIMLKNIGFNFTDIEHIYKLFSINNKSKALPSKIKKIIIKSVQ